MGRRGLGVLAVRIRRDDPRHLRQLSVTHVGGEGIDQVLGGAVLRIVGVGAGHDPAPAPVQRVAHVHGAEARERGQRVVAVVVVLLVDAPVDAGLLQAFGIGGPAQADEVGPVALHVRGPVAVVHVVHRLIAVVAHAQPAAAGEQIHAVGIGRPVQRAEIAIAHGEGIGQRVIERDVRALQMPHAQRALVRHPAVVLLPAGRILAARAFPVVVQALHHRRAGGARVQVEGQHGRAAILALLPHRRAIAQPQRARVVEAAHPAQRAEVMIEGAVLLHQDHHMLHVRQRAAAHLRRQRQRAADGGRQQAGGGQRREALQEIATRKFVHTDISETKESPAQRRPPSGIRQMFVRRTTSGTSSPRHRNFMNR